MRARWIASFGAIGLAAAALTIGLSGKHHQAIRDRPDKSFSITSSGSTAQTATDEAYEVTFSEEVSTGTFSISIKTYRNPFGFFEPR